MTEFMTSKALYLRFVKLLILSSTFSLRLIIINFEMLATILVKKVAF